MEIFSLALQGSASMQFHKIAEFFQEEIPGITWPTRLDCVLVDDRTVPQKFKRGFQKILEAPLISEPMLRVLACMKDEKKWLKGTNLEVCLSLPPQENPSDKVFLQVYIPFKLLPGPPSAFIKSPLSATSPSCPSTPELLPALEGLSQQPTPIQSQSPLCAEGPTSDTLPSELSLATSLFGPLTKGGGGSGCAPSVEVRPSTPAIPAIMSAVNSCGKKPSEKRRFPAHLRDAILFTQALGAIECSPKRQRTDQESADSDRDRSPNANAPDANFSASVT